MATDREAAKDYVRQRAMCRPPVFADRAARRLESWVMVDFDDDLIAMITNGSRPSDWDGVLGRFAAAIFALDRLLAGHAAARPPRRMPSLKKIADHHCLPMQPFCVGCGLHTPVSEWRNASPYLDRAHIIDRCYGGLDAAQNLAPLCQACHKVQPIFEPGDEDEAMEWFALPWDGGGTP